MSEKEEISPELAALRFEAMIRANRSKEKWLKGNGLSGCIFFTATPLLLIELIIPTSEEVRDSLSNEFQKITEYMEIDSALLKVHREAYRPFVYELTKMLMGEESSHDAIELTREWAGKRSQLFGTDSDSFDTDMIFLAGNHKFIFNTYQKLLQESRIIIGGKSVEEDEQEREQKERERKQAEKEAVESYNENQGSSSSAENSDTPSSGGCLLAFIFMPFLFFGKLFSNLLG